jgi:aspartyl aminopeptidase
MPVRKKAAGSKGIKDKVMFKPRLVWDALSPRERKEVHPFAEDYKDFLNRAKTEREAVHEIERRALACGFKSIAGDGSHDKMYKVHRRKAIGMAVLGKRPLREGIKILVSHIDAPRLDLKQNPLYEEVDLAMCKTHYYGGIKKYQWVCRPLALHGKIIRQDGSELDLTIGESETDPVFTVADLLPHLAHKVQYEKKLNEAIAGEKLNALAGSIPYPDKKAPERVKLQILNYLYKTHKLVEEDFISAEIELVPAGKARDIGLDMSLIGAYGQDDRICAYGTLDAICRLSKPRTTALALFLDKEEIGSEGNTGAKSKFLEEMVASLFRCRGEAADEQLIRETLMNSHAISADVNAALDPDYQEVHEKRNAARLGYGVCISKFTGSGGKYASSDANAEYVGIIRRLFNRHGVVWQAGEMGKVDEGGGGTVAKFLASYGMEIIDCGTALLSMHSPFEIASKADAFMTGKAYRVFLTEDLE